MHRDDPEAQALGDRQRDFTGSSTAISRRSHPPSRSCRGATRRWRIASAAGSFFPKGRASSRIDFYLEDGNDDPLAWAFGALGIAGSRRHLATLYLNDIADVLRDAVDPRFEFVRYAESLAQSQPTFDPLAEALAAPLNLVDQYAA